MGVSLPVLCGLLLLLPCLTLMMAVCVRMPPCDALCCLNTDEDFEKWCAVLFEALEEQPELLGAAAGAGDESLATYRVTMVEGTLALCSFCVLVVPLHQLSSTRNNLVA